MDALKLDAFVYPTWSNPPRLIGDLNTPHSRGRARPRRASAGSAVRSADRKQPVLFTDDGMALFTDDGMAGDQRADGLHAGRTAAGQDDVFRPRLVGGDADSAGVCVRAGDSPPAPAGDRAAAPMIAMIDDRGQTRVRSGSDQGQIGVRSG
jgi:hypothetical protein